MRLAPDLHTLQLQLRSSKSCDTTSLEASSLLHREQLSSNPEDTEVHSRHSQPVADGEF